MKWSWKLGRYAGIDVYVHATFLVLVAWIGLSYWFETGSLGAVAGGVGFILALFASVLLHEYGHALMARRYGIRTRDITLLPVGGLARLERMPDDPRQELWVALAGPAVNVVLAGCLFLWLSLTNGLGPVEELGVTSGSFLERLLASNIALVVFNMLPAFPMDGGRVLRALLATRLEYVQATQIAAQIGQGLAFLLGLAGLFTNPFLVFIALFVWIGAAQEVSMTQMKTALAGVPLRGAMITDYRTLRTTDSLARAVELVLSGSQQDFPVVEEDRVVGILTRADLLAALGKHGETYPVASAMQRKFQTADASDMLEMVFRRLQDCSCHTIPVLRRGQLAGLVTMENLGEFIMVQSALRGRRPQAQPSFGYGRSI